MTIAEQFAAQLGDDGQRFETDSGTSFDDLAEQMGASVTYSERRYTSGIDTPYTLVDGFSGSHYAGDPIRYEFPDGSAVVVAGDAWDIEGPARYSWAGA